MTQTHPSPNTQTLSTQGNSALQDAAAEALSAALPVSLPITARRFPDLGRSAQHSAPSADGEPALPDAAALTAAGDLAVVRFVGGHSADAAVHVDPGVLGDAAALDPTLVSLDDVLRPAFEAATGVLGTGVLSTAPASAAEPLLRDPETALFQLVASDRVVGWFALRLREPATAPGGTAEAATTPTTPQHQVDDDVAARLSRLNNVQMALTVEIGRARVSVREVLGLEPGAVIELDRNAGAPADVRLNGRLIAQGEVVVMDQDYGVRITKILDAAEGLT